MASFHSTVIRFGICQWIYILLISLNQAESQQQAATRRTETKTYQYEYDIGSQYHNETKGPNGVVKGEYGHWSPDGWFRITNYTADKDGYRVNRRRLRARKGQFGTSGQPEFPVYNNKQPQGGAHNGPPGIGGTLGAPGVYTPRTPYSPTPYGAGAGVNGVGGYHGLGDRPGQQTYETGIFPAGSTSPDSDQHAAESRPVEVKPGVPPLGVYPSQVGYPSTLGGRGPWTTGSDTVTVRPGTGLGGSIGQYPIAAPTTKSTSAGPFRTVYPGLQQTTPPSQSYKYPPSGSGIQDGYSGGLSSKPTGSVTNKDGQKDGLGSAGGPYGSGTSGPYGSGGPETDDASGTYVGAGQKTGDENSHYGSGYPDASGTFGGVTPKTSGTSRPFGPGFPGTGGVDTTIYGGAKPQIGDVSGSHGGVGPGTGGTGTSQQAGGPSGGISSGNGGANWPYGRATTRYPSNGQKPGYPPIRYEFPSDQTSDRSCRLQPGHSTIPVGFPENVKPLGVARDDHSTSDGKMLGKYTLTFPFGYIMEISYSAYQDPALAAKYLPQQTHNPNC